MPKKSEGKTLALTLVHHSDGDQAITGLAAVENRRLVFQLTQQLVDVLIQMNDLLDEDPDLEVEEDDDSDGL